MSEVFAGARRNFHYPACTYWRELAEYYPDAKVVLTTRDADAWFERLNQEVIDLLSPERLLVFSPKEGWEPLCSFLGVPIPKEPFPRVNSRDELDQASSDQGGLPADPEEAEKFGREYIEQLKAQAFGS